MELTLSTPVVRLVATDTKSELHAGIWVNVCCAKLTGKESVNRFTNDKKKKKFIVFALWVLLTLFGLCIV